MNVKIYHNPRCSKSRQTLGLLNEKNIQPEIVEYLKTQLQIKELSAIRVSLGVAVRDMMRTNESIYKELGLAEPSVTDAQLFQAIVENPVLLQRPIVMANKKAAIGRPPENVLDIL